MSAEESVQLNKAKITEEFAQVLEQIFKRSLSSGDTSPYRRQLEAVSDSETIEPFPPNPSEHCKTASQKAIVHRSSPDSNETKCSEAGLHSSSGTSTAGNLSCKNGNVVDYSSCSSDESNVSSGSNKKTTNFFKKIRERFKRGSGSYHTSADSDNESGHEYAEAPCGRPKRSQKKQKVNGTVGRTNSEKSKYSLSPGQQSQASGPLYEPYTLTHPRVDHKLSGCGDVSGHPNMLHIETTDILDTNFMLRDNHPVARKKEEKEVFLSKLKRLLKKNSSQKKRASKSSKEGHKRSKSADDVHIHGVHPVDLSKTDRSVQPQKQVTRIKHSHVKPVPVLVQGPRGRLRQQTDDSWQQQQIDVTYGSADARAEDNSGSYNDTRSGIGARGKLHLAGLIPNHPNLPYNIPSCSVDYDSELADNTKTKSDDLDRVDGTTLDLGLSDRVVTEIGAKPFEERTHDEKDQLYSIIADKLNLIADHYHESKGSSVDGITSPMSSIQMQSNRTSISTYKRASPRGVDDVDAIQKELAQCLRIKGDNIHKQYPEVQEVATELAVGLTYGQFETMVNNHVQQEPSMQNLATFVTVTKTAVKLVGATGAVAQGMKEMTLRYFEDKFAEWIFNKGGLESMVEDFDSADLYSEVD